MQSPQKALLAPNSGSHSGGTRVLERGSLPLVLHGLPRGSVQKHRQSGSTAQTRPATRPVASVPHSGGAFGRVSSTEHGASLSRGWATQPPDETEHSRLWTLPPRGLDLSGPPGWASPPPAPFLGPPPAHHLCRAAAFLFLKAIDTFSPNPQGLTSQFSKNAAFRNRSRWLCSAESGNSS